MKIIISTGIYPPQRGGPAKYAKNLKEAFSAEGVKVDVLKYGIENALPTGVRHVVFFVKAFIKLMKADLYIALDQFSVGFPSVSAAKILGKKIIIRTGGDFLWESYVERTGDLVLFRNFYSGSKNNFSRKEKIIYSCSRWTMRNASAVIFSTEWQRNIFIEAYGLDSKKCFVVENYYGDKTESKEPMSKTFIAGTRALKWKNHERLIRAFGEARQLCPDISLDISNAPYEKFTDKIKSAYAIILVSLGDISPNMILDALRAGKPFILTKETGLYDRLKDVAVFVDPEDEKDIVEKITFLSDKLNYSKFKTKVERFTFFHSWKNIRNEFMDIYDAIK